LFLKVDSLSLSEAYLKRKEKIPIGVSCDEFRFRLYMYKRFAIELEIKTRKLGFEN